MIPLALKKRKVMAELLVGFQGALIDCQGSAEYSNAIVHAFQRFRAPFSGKIVHIFPEQSAVI